MYNPISPPEDLRKMMWETYEAVWKPSIYDSAVIHWHILNPNTWIPVDELDAWLQTEQAARIKRAVATAREENEENIRYAAEKDARAKAEKATRGRKRNQAQLQDDSTATDIDVNAIDHATAARGGKRKKTQHVTDNRNAASYVSSQTTNESGYGRAVSGRDQQHQQLQSQQEQLSYNTLPFVAQPLDPLLEHNTQHQDLGRHYSSQLIQTPPQQVYDVSEHQIQAPVPAARSNMIDSQPGYPEHHSGYYRRGTVKYSTTQQGSIHTSTTIPRSSHGDMPTTGLSCQASTAPNGQQPTPPTEQTRDDVLNQELGLDDFGLDIDAWAQDVTFDNIEQELQAHQATYPNQQASRAQRDASRQSQPMQQSQSYGSHVSVPRQHFQQPQLPEGTEWAQALIPQVNTMKRHPYANIQATPPVPRRNPRQQMWQPGTQYQQVPQVRPPLQGHQGRSRARYNQPNRRPQLPPASEQQQQNRAISSTGPNQVPRTYQISVPQNPPPEIRSPKPVRPPSEQVRNMINTDDRLASGPVRGHHRVSPTPISGGYCEPRVHPTTSQAARPRAGTREQLQGRGSMREPQEQLMAPRSSEPIAAIPTASVPKRKLNVDEDGLEITEAPVKRTKRAPANGAQSSSSLRPQNRRVSQLQRGSSIKQGSNVRGSGPPSSTATSTSRDNPVPRPDANISPIQTSVKHTSPSVQSTNSNTPSLDKPVVSVHTDAGSLPGDQSAQPLSSHKRPNEQNEELGKGGTVQSHKPDPQPRQVSIEWLLDNCRLEECSRAVITEMATAKMLRDRFSADRLADFFTHDELVSKGMIGEADLKLSKALSSIDQQTSSIDEQVARQAERDRLRNKEYLDVVRSHAGPYRVPADMPERESLLLMLALEDALAAQFPEFSLEPADVELLASWTQGDGDLP